MTGLAEVDNWLAAHGAALVEVRRALHRRPELGRQEHATTALLVDRLTASGLAPKVLSTGTGVVCDVGSGDPVVVVRGDIDALPVEDVKHVPYRSEVPGVCHACGHDVHTAVVLGVGLALAGLPLPGTVRLVFQPAEELMPGGALDVVAEGWLRGTSAVLALHCDPGLEVGFVGLKAGPLTAATDNLAVRLSGPGGHTSRPQNTVDLVHALSSVATGLPDALSRLVDPRAGLCVVWGEVHAGASHNAIPQEGRLAGTVRVLDLATWQRAPELVERLVHELVAPYGAHATVTYARGVPPVVNDPQVTALLTRATVAALGPDAAVPAVQSLGGEDFAWYLDHVPGAMARLGVRTPDSVVPMDLHQPAFDADERAIAIGVRLLAQAALTGLLELTTPV